MLVTTQVKYTNCTTIGTNFLIEILHGEKMKRSVHERVFHNKKCKIKVELKWNCKHKWRETEKYKIDPASKLLRKCHSSTLHRSCAYLTLI